MLATRLATALCVAWLVSVTASCAGLEALDAPSDPLSATERTAVREQADASVGEGRFKAAWNQEVAAGADRDRLEGIAVEALRRRSRHAEDMFDALRAKWGGLREGPRAGVDALVTEARVAEDWGRALELELTSADDPPAFSRAWAVYRGAPPERAPALLEAIRAARADREETQD